MYKILNYKALLLLHIQKRMPSDYVIPVHTVVLLMIVVISRCLLFLCAPKITPQKVIVIMIMYIQKHKTEWCIKITQHRTKLLIKQQVANHFQSASTLHMCNVRIVRTYWCKNV